MKTTIINISREFRFRFNSKRPRRLLFNHLPKCGGTTVKSFLRSQYPSGRAFIFDSQDAQKSIDQFNDLSYREKNHFHLIVGHYAHELITAVEPSTECMIIFRDPVDRIISNYHYVLAQPTHYLHSKVADRRLTLKEYVESGISNQLRNWYTWHLTKIDIEEIERHPADAMECACTVLKKHYEHVGILDDLQSFMDQLSLSMNFRGQFSNTVMNKTGNRPRREAIEAETIDAIQNVNHADCMLYDRIVSRSL